MGGICRLVKQSRDFVFLTRCKRAEICRSMQQLPGMSELMEENLKLLRTFGIKFARNELI